MGGGILLLMHSPLGLLRRAAPGSPTQVQVAKRMGYALTTLKSFEVGLGRVSEDFLRAYAVEIGATFEQVRFLYLSMLEKRLEVMHRRIAGARTPRRRRT